jgi:hypothetical protein
LREVAVFTIVVGVVVGVVSAEDTLTEIHHWKRAIHKNKRMICHKNRL